jgi:hypothetical protein
VSFNLPVPLPSIVIGSLVGLVGIVFLAIFGSVGAISFMFSVPATAKAETTTEDNNVRR